MVGWQDWLCILLVFLTALVLIGWEVIRTGGGKVFTLNKRDADNILWRLKQFVKNSDGVRITTEEYQLNRPEDKRRFVFNDLEFSDIKFILTIDGIEIKKNWVTLARINNEDEVRFEEKLVLIKSKNKIGKYQTIEIKRIKNTN